MNYDVLIVGGGTAGLHLAYNLSRAGFSVVVVEKRPLEKLYKITGDAIGKTHLERSNINLPPRVIENEYRGAKVISPLESITLTIPGEGYSLNMYEWSRFLASRALNAGATLLDKTTAVKPLVNGLEVEGILASREGSGTMELRAKITVDASGATAVIRTRLPREWPVSEPLRPEDVSYAYREIIEIDYEIPEPDYIRIYLNQEISPGGYWWFFPKSKTVANVGLGVWGRLVKERGLNPVHLYRKYLEKRAELRKKEVLSSGGGIVPTRRPLSTMVWNRFLAAGDAAVAVNPVHGGGLGPALLTADLASHVIVEASERGSYDLRTLWKYNKLYLQHYGIKQAKLDIMRLALQHMSNSEIEQGLRANLVSSEEILQLSAEGRELRMIEKLKIVLRALRLPLSVIKKLLLAQAYMKKVELLYRSYPEDISYLPSWQAQIEKLYSEYLSKLSKLVSQS